MRASGEVRYCISVWIKSEVVIEGREDLAKLDWAFDHLACCYLARDNFRQQMDPTHDRIFEFRFLIFE